MTKLEQETKALNDTYISLWLRGQVMTFIGIMNMYAVVSSTMSFLNNEEFNMVTIACVIITSVCAYFTVKLQNESRIIFAQLKNNLPK